jgi:hypothetical protein
LAFGVIQAASPLALRWLDQATVGSSTTQINQPGSVRAENRPRKNARSSRRHIAAAKRSADQWWTCRISSPPCKSRLMATTAWYAWLIVTPSSNRYEPR